jgi:N-acetylmuramic acid 6-phosphate etherase
VLPPEKSIFAGVWIGGAGLDRAADLASIRARIASLLNLLDDKALIVTNDATLLSSAIIASQYSSFNHSNISSGVVLITGTGAFAQSYVLPTSKDSSLPVPFDRSSGWGYLLGDEGSAFVIGRDAIRGTLDRRDRGDEPTSLDLAILDHFGCETVKELLSAIYLDPPPSLKDGQDPSSADADPKLRIAGVCRLAFSHAFPSSSSVAQDQQAMEIIQRSASSAAVSVVPLITNKTRKVDPATSVLVFGGALAQIDQYRDMIVDALRVRGHVFARLECVKNAAEAGVQVLIRDFLV